MSAGRVVRVRLDGAADQEPLRDRSYDVVVRPGVLAGEALANELAEAVKPEPLRGKRVFAVIDAGVPVSTIDAALAGLHSAGAQVFRAEIEPSEPVKSLATLERLLVGMTEARLERGDLVLAIGGGIVGDVAGFAAATYRRGIGVVQCPTTLLAMVDASVGGKTGVNLRTTSGSLKKNMAGAFHQPRRVLADPSVLASLPPRQLRAGLAECVKHALLAADFGDAELGEFLTADMAKFLACDTTALAELVARNVAIKAKVVEGDEREERVPVPTSIPKPHKTSPQAQPVGVGETSAAEHPGRMVLNLGHTFGHALETMPGLAGNTDEAGAQGGGLHHGEAVALGTVCAAHCARAMGMADDALVAHVENFLRAAGLPTRLREAGAGGLPTPEQILDAMRDDKKVGGGKLRLVLPTPGGRCVVVEDPPIPAVMTGIGAILGTAS